MNRAPKGSSLISNTLGLFKKKHQRVASHMAREASAQIILNQKGNPLSSSRAQLFNAAAIEFDDCACQAVRNLNCRRFLVRDIPPIPVPDCTSMNCSCTYVRYTDRRSWDDDRRAAFSVRSDLHMLGGDKDRRTKRLRRADDEPVFAASDLRFDSMEWAR